MNKITKLGLYLNELQYDRLRVLAEQKGVTPEQAANEVLYSYLAIVDPFSGDNDGTAEP